MNKPKWMEKFKRNIEHFNLVQRVCHTNHYHQSSSSSVTECVTCERCLNDIPRETQAINIFTEQSCMGSSNPSFPTLSYQSPSTWRCRDHLCRCHSYSGLGLSTSIARSPNSANSNSFSWGGQQSTGTQMKVELGINSFQRRYRITIWC